MGAPHVPVIGLVGGVGAGKSFVAHGLASRRRVRVIAADPIGHDVLKLPAVKAQLRSQFGDEVFGEDGEIDRRKMGQAVFGPDPESVARRRALEAIVHPQITRELECRLAAARGEPGIELIVVDAALLLETGWNSMCDRVVFVNSPRHDRLERVLRDRGWSEADLDRREASQWSLEKKRAASHAVVNNDASGAVLDELEPIVNELTSADERPRGDAPACPK